MIVVEQAIAHCYVDAAVFDEAWSSGKMLLSCLCGDRVAACSQVVDPLVISEEAPPANTGGHPPVDFPGWCF